MEGRPALPTLRDTIFGYYPARPVRNAVGTGNVMILSGVPPLRVQAVNEIVTRFYFAVI